MPIKRSSLNREAAVKYIEAILLGGVEKKEAYLQHVDPGSRNPYSAIATMESKKEFMDLYQSIFSDDTMKLQATLMRIRGKALGLVEKNIDTATKLLDVAADDGQDTRDRINTIKLVNETITAMAVVQTGQQQEEPGAKRLNRGGVVL